jgi:hypothetical protein
MKIWLVHTIFQGELGGPFGSIAGVGLTSEVTH